MVMIADGLVKCFRGVRAVDSLSFEIRDGSFTALIGANGSGKSTTLKMCTGLLRPDAGTVMIDGHDVITEPVAMKKMGCIIETPNLYADVSPYRMLKHICGLYRVPVAEVDSRIQRTLDMVGMNEHADRRIGRFSKGMKQRIGLAQALVCDPELLILDEPMSGLDPKGIVEIRSLLKDLNAGGTTILMSTHDLHEAQTLCRDAILIQDGKLVKRIPLSENTRSPESTVIIGFSGNLSENDVRGMRSATGVTGISLEGQSIRIVYRNDETSSNRIIQLLISMGVSVTSVSLGDDLERIYLEQMEDGA